MACSAFKEQPLSWPCENCRNTPVAYALPFHPHSGLELEDSLAQGTRLPFQINWFFSVFYFSNLFLSYYLCSALQFCLFFFLFALLSTLSRYSWITWLSREHADLIHSYIMTWWWIFDFLWLSLAENSENGDSLAVIICLPKTLPKVSLFKSLLGAVLLLLYLYLRKECQSIKESAQRSQNL